METLPKALCSAMAKAFSEITGAARTKENNHLRYKYAELQDVIDAIKPHIAKYGLWFYQIVHIIDGYAAIETVIVHESGESLSCGIVRVPIGKGDAQGYGSALTYARKYSLSSAFGVAQDDDDGEKACVPDNKTQKQSSEKIVEMKADTFVEPPSREELVTILSNKLRESTDSFDSGLFEDYLLYLEERCANKQFSFYDVLTTSSKDIKSMLDGYNTWLQKKKTAKRATGV